MIKAIHFADFHLGVDTHGALDPETKLPGRVLDFLDTFDALIDYAKDFQADIVLFAGDAFHKHSPDPTLLREFGDRIVRLAELCPVILLVGNHDVTGVMEKASAVDIFSTLRVPNVIVGYDYQIYRIDTANGIIQVATAPYPMPNMFLSVKEKARQDRSIVLRNKLSKTLKRLASEVDPRYPAILLGHFAVNSAAYSSERVDYLGDSADVDIVDLVDDAWDYVALGHLHLHQDLSVQDEDGNTFAPAIVYAGSLERVDFGEEHDKKGFVWVEFDTDGMSWEFVEVDSRPFVTVDVNVIGAENQTKKIISKINKTNLVGAIVRVHVYTDEGRGSSINRTAIYQALQDAKAYYIHDISIREERSIRTRLDPDIKMTEMDHDGMLNLYLKEIGIEKKETKRLLKIAGELMDEVNLV